jgi:hypothetical protein
VAWTDTRAVMKRSTWIVPAPLVKVRDSVNCGLCTVWISGGNEGDRVIVTNRIETTEGRKNERSFLIVVG